MLLRTGPWPGDVPVQRLAAELGHETASALPLPDDAAADWACAGG